MCGRIRQKGEEPNYFDMIKWNPHRVFDPTYKRSPNVPPGSRPLVMHRLGDGSEQADCLFWGYKPPWFKRPAVSNARLDKIMDGAPFWRPLLTRRIIVPVDGWYEWVGDKGDKQPWYINPKDGEPILMAAITAWEPGKEVLAETGFVVVTDDSAGGMVDIHDRRPIVLTATDALEWLDPNTTTDQAKRVLSAARPESAFQWWQVTRAMGNSRYQLADASEPKDASA